MKIASDPRYYSLRFSIMSEYKEIVATFSRKAAEFLNSRPDLLEELWQNRYRLDDYVVPDGDAEAILRDWYLFEAESSILQENLLEQLLKAGVFSRSEPVFEEHCGGMKVTQHTLGLSDEKHFREYYQQAAVGLGLIEMTIPVYGGDQSQKRSSAQVVPWNKIDTLFNKE